MEKYKYILKVPFELTGNSSIKIEETDKIKFYLENYEITLRYDKKNQKGYFKIRYFYNETEIFPFYTQFKKTIHLLNLTPTIWCIKIKEFDNETIKANIEIKELSEEKHENYNIKFSFKDTIMISETTFKLKPIIFKPISEIINHIQKNYSNISSLDFTKNEKLETALDLYINSYFQNENSKFLTLITILELLKPNIKRKGIGKSCIDELLELINKYKEKPEIKNNNELRSEFDGIYNKIKELEERSINYSIKQIPSENEIKLSRYPNIRKMLSDSYNVRSKFVHEGIILDEFYPCLTFLEFFVPELIKKEINKIKI